MQMGCSLLKFFPAGAAGGIQMLKSMAAPYLHTGVRFIPTGGVNQANASDYLAETCVLAVGGTWIAKRDMIAAGDWARITRNAEQALAAVNA